MSTVLSPIAGRVLKFKVSPDSWTSTYTLVCLMNQRMRAARSSNKQDTQCGIVTSRGSIDRTFELQFLDNATPDALAVGVGEVSYELWQSWFESDTALKFKRQSPDGSGTDLHQEGTIYIESIDDEAAVDGNLIVTTTVSVQGALDITP